MCNIKKKNKKIKKQTNKHDTNVLILFTHQGKKLSRLNKQQTANNIQQFRIE